MFPTVRFCNFPLFCAKKQLAHIIQLHIHVICYYCIFCNVVTLLIDSLSPWGNICLIVALAWGVVSGLLNFSLTGLQWVSTYCFSNKAAIWRICKTPSWLRVSSVRTTPYSGKKIRNSQYFDALLIPYKLFLSWNQVLKK